MYVKIYEFMRHIETEYQALMDDTGLNVGEIHVIRSLFEKNGQHPGILAQSVGRPATSFTPMIDGLVGKGFVERRPDPDDRRAIRVYLTVLGENLRQNVIQYSEEADEQLEAELGAYLPVELLTEHEPGVGRVVHQDGTVQKANVNEWLSLS